MKDREAPYTVAELIAELQKFPPDMRVMTCGYEGGYHDCDAPAVKDVRLNVHCEWFYGPHEDADYGGSDEGTVIKAAII